MDLSRSPLVHQLSPPAARPDPVADADAALALVGELDIAAAPSVRALLEPAVAGRAPVVTVDASAVTFADCSGLEPLLEAAARLRRRGARLQVAPASPAVRRVATLVWADWELGLDPRDPGPRPPRAG